LNAAATADASNAIIRNATGGSSTAEPDMRGLFGNATGGSGTAEPDMRGLYILLTINNDGGMDVFKYAARLSRDRPEIFNSKPVQLAVQVYKVSCIMPI
jgi:hypothetical protein